jgi:hypothetical protein
MNNIPHRFDWNNKIIIDGQYYSNFNLKRESITPKYLGTSLYHFEIPRIGDAIYSFKWLIKSSNLLCNDIYDYLSGCQVVLHIGGQSFIRCSVINSTIFSYIMGKKYKKVSGQFIIPFECGLTTDRCIPIRALYWHTVEFFLITKKLPFDVQFQFKRKEDPDLCKKINEDPKLMLEYPVLLPYVITDDYFFNPLFFVIYYKSSDKDIELLRFEYEYSPFIYGQEKRQYNYIVVSGDNIIKKKILGRLFNIVPIDVDCASIKNIRHGVKDGSIFKITKSLHSAFFNIKKIISLPTTSDNNIEIFVISDNLTRICSGMAGHAYTK